MFTDYVLLIFHLECLFIDRVDSVLHDLRLPLGLPALAWKHVHLDVRVRRVGQVSPRQPACLMEHHNDVTIVGIVLQTELDFSQRSSIVLSYGVDGRVDPDALGHWDHGIGQHFVQ